MFGNDHIFPHWRSYMNAFRQSFGTTFRTIRKSKGMNQDEVAERAGLSTSYISDVERGAANPKLDTIEALARGIDVDVMNLFNFTKRNVPPEELKKRIIEYIQNEDDSSIESIYHKMMNILAE